MSKLGLPSFSRKKLIVIGFLLVLIIGIPITVFLVQQQQVQKSGATKATTLALVPPSKTVAVGDTVSLDVSLDPGVNQVNFVKFVVKYDPTKLTPSSTSFTVNSASNLSILAGPTLDTGSISVTLSVGAAFQNAIQSPTSIGSFSFEAQAPTDTPTPVTFDETLTQIRSLGSSDTATENVLSSTTPSQITITGLAPSPTPTATPAATLNCTLAANPTSVTVGGSSALTPTCQGTPTTYAWTTTCGTLATTNGSTNTLTAPAVVPNTNNCVVSLNACDASNNCSNPSTTVTVTAAAATPTASPITTTNVAPVCQSLTLDKTNSGAAPYTLNFSLTGADSDGTITKTTFNFGDGTVQDSTDGSGSNSISTQLSHTYNSAGTFTASATLTDSNGNVSATTNCTQAISISSSIAQTDQAPTVLPATGPDKTILGVGALGIALSFIGVILFLAL